MRLRYLDFVRLLRHMKEDKPNPRAQERLLVGKKILAAMNKAFKQKTNDKE
jgi:hypothetical protein